MPAVRAFVAMIAVGFLGTWLTNAPTTDTRPQIVVRTAATTTTVASSTTTTEAPQPPASQSPRASRGAAHRSPPTTAPGPVVRSSADEVPCWLWPEGANRSRARSDECWRSLVAEFDWPVDRMLTLLYCESHGNAWVRNGKHANLLQVAGATAGDDEEHNGARAHLALAHSVYERAGGTSPWWQCGG